MNKKLHEDEYRFDRVKKSERKGCMNWEYERERRLLNWGEPLKRWQQLDDHEKASCDEHTVFDHAIPEAVRLASASSLSTPYLTDPNETHHTKVVTLPRMLVRWNRSDPAILKGFNTVISAWLKEQRQTDPSARDFRGRPRLGKPPNVLSLLADLAVYRLRRRMNLSGPQIYEKLKDFEKLDGVSPTFIKGKVFEGNLERTCDRVPHQFFWDA
jgi:hypothetical protein